VLANDRPTELQFEPIHADVVADPTDSAEVISSHSLFAILRYLPPVQIDVQDTGEARGGRILEAPATRQNHAADARVAVDQIEMPTDGFAVEAHQDQIGVREKRIHQLF